jgi:hypothetical protein
MREDDDVDVNRIDPEPSQVTHAPDVRTNTTCVPNRQRPSAPTVAGNRARTASQPAAGAPGNASSSARG